ncbi:hypothetical protein [Dactylosporangium sp. NPDC048998]|uniref:hypothetical protein n=1 Tax=Dactylosporangium sp. NPDC048998 TaxID=3363976 RepID=UPI0037154B16
MTNRTFNFINFMTPVRATRDRSCRERLVWVDRSEASSSQTGRGGSALARLPAMLAVPRTRGLLPRQTRSSATFIRPPGYFRLSPPTATPAPPDRGFHDHGVNVLLLVRVHSVIKANRVLGRRVLHDRGNVVLAALARSVQIAGACQRRADVDSRDVDGPTGGRS